MRWPDRTTIERFDEKCVVSPDTGCWLWTGYTHKGYARFNLGGRAVDAHRWVYEQLVGPVPAGLQLDHKCHTWDKNCLGGVQCEHRRCVSPSHLQPVTPRTNARRGRSIVATRAAQTHCLRGHEFTPENTSIVGRNQRRCLKCHAFRESGRRARAFRGQPKLDGDQVF